MEKKLEGGEKEKGEVEVEEKSYGGTRQKAKTTFC